MVRLLLEVGADADMVAAALRRADADLTVRRDGRDMVEAHRAGGAGVECHVDGVVMAVWAAGEYADMVRLPVVRLHPAMPGVLAADAAGAAVTLEAALDRLVVSTVLPLLDAAADRGHSCPSATP